MDTLVKRLEKDFPALLFKPGNTFAWSPKSSSVLYVNDAKDKKVAGWSLLHEVSHALLRHKAFESDFELLLLEVEAWEKAKKLSAKYGAVIDNEHIQNCLDTYRDWLYQRSTCPSCTATSMQTDKHTYTCLNCHTSWRISGSRLCRPYRMTKAKQKEALA